MLFIFKKRPAAVGVTLALFWLDLVYQLAAQWSIYPQYSYGWAVPVLMGYFFWRRWKKRPSPDHSSSVWTTSVLIIGLAAGFFFTRLVQEANLIWRLPSWLMALEVVGITLGAVYLVGGHSWLKYFSFPILFFLVAIPWLRPIEEPFIEALTQFNAKATVEIFSLLGIPVFQQGNVIETNKGLVGIDEACSGVRSFQATLMLVLAFGEYYFLTLKQRGQLLLAGLGLAIGSNILRTTTLVFVCTQQGRKAMEAWHDPTGVAILVICFASLWGISRFSSGSRKESFLPSPTSGVAFLNRIPKFLFPLLAVSLIGAELGIEAWYRFHEQRFADKISWNVYSPEIRKPLHEFEISKTIKDRLKYDQGLALGWNGQDGHKWQMLYFEWNPARSRQQRILVQDGKNHMPESCLSATGKKLISDEGIKIFEVQGLALPFRSYVFEHEGERMSVYFCLWQDNFAHLNSLQYKKYLASSPRLAAIASGNRSFGQGLQVLEVAVWGIEQQEADRSVENELQKWIRVNQIPSL